MVNDYSNYQQIQPQAFSNTVGRTVSSPMSPSAVNINIISPSVYGTGQAQIPYMPIYSYPQAQTLPPPPVISKAAINPAEAEEPVSKTLPVQAKAEPTESTKPQGKKKEIVPLSDEYIMTVENYLNNPNEQIRMTGVKEVMGRFKEDDSRKRDAALTALLNKSLMDKSSNIRLVAMTTLASGYAAGDNTTVGLLNSIQQQKTNYNEDALMAAQALAKMSEQINVQKVEVNES